MLLLLLKKKKRRRRKGTVTEKKIFFSCFSFYNSAKKIFPNKKSRKTGTNPQQFRCMCLTNRKKAQNLQGTLLHKGFLIDWVRNIFLLR